VQRPRYVPRAGSASRGQCSLAAVTPAPAARPRAPAVRRRSRCRDRRGTPGTRGRRGPSAPWSRRGASG